MQRMVTFRLNRESREIAVNPDKVLYVCTYEHGASSLHFGKECFVRVQGDMAEVVQKLEAALGARSDTEPATKASAPTPPLPVEVH